MTDDSTERIVAALRFWIAAATPGARLPSSRALTAEHAASPVTVQKAVQTLVSLGLVETRPGVGTFVRAPRTAAPVDYGWQTAALAAPHPRLPVLSETQRSIGPDEIGLHAGYPDPELLPERLVRTAIARAARTAAAIERAPAAGHPELRTWFAAELAALAPVPITPPGARDVVITSGSQSGLSSIFRALVGPGEPLVIESPTYWGAIQAAASAGVPLVPVPSGADGPDPEELERAIVRSGARAAYVQPTYANPTGAQWAPAVADALLEVAVRHGAFLIEDDWAHDLAIDTDARPLAARDHDGHVVYLRSLTKSVSPALRVAAVVARGPARDRVLADRAAGSLYVSELLQTATLDVVRQPGWRTHRRDVRTRLRARRDLLIRSLAEHVPAAHLLQVPRGGLNLWLRLPDGTDVQAVTRECRARGVLVAPGDEWFPAEPTGPHLRLNYSGPGPDRFAEAARVIGEVLAGQSP